MQAVSERSMSRWRIMVMALVAAIVCALACAFPAHAYAAGDTSWYRGHEGDSTYTLTNANQLAGLADLVNSGTTFQGKTVKLGALPNAGVTLRLSGEWTPIGTAAHPFNGTFEGNGSTLSGLTITAGSQNLGLFGYCGAQSSIKDLTISGNIKLVLPASSTALVKNVGGVVGYTGGSVSGIRSSVAVNINTQVAATATNNLVVSYVGAIAGVVRGNLTDCTTTTNSSVYVLATSEAPNSDLTWIVESVGGIVGSHGPDVTDVASLKNATTIARCTNNAKVQIQIPTQGANDRFGNPTFATGSFSGGIAGFSSGNITSCRNTGEVTSAVLDSAGDPVLGVGMRAVGGIVGGYRVDEELTTATDTDDPGLRYNIQTKGGTAPITLQDCANTATVFGLAQAGGVVGQAGSYTTILASYNTGRVEASRYTKPSPGGVVGRSYGVIAYCYNTGSVVSTTGGGYYAAGIVGMFHALGKDYNGNTVVPEAYGCYNTGYIETSSAQFRSGSLVGELDGGYMHDCWSLEGRSLNKSVSGLDNYVGTMVNCDEIPETQALTTANIAALNASASNDAWAYYFTLPEGAKYNQVISSAGVVTGPRIVAGSFVGTSATDLSKTSGTVTVEKNAAYSASVDPVPTVTVKLANGTALVQNADYKVVPQADTKGAKVGTTCTGTIVGIGIYTGQLPQSFTYTIEKGPISECTISAEEKYFNWSKQKPDTVIVRDSAGNIVDPSEYTWSVDTASFNNASSAAYVNAQTGTNATGYPITITAASSGNYSGALTQNCFKISPVSFAGSSPDSANPNQSTLIAGPIVWGDQTWEFGDVCDFYANGGMGDGDKRGVMKIKYTGQPITPEITYVTYMGRQLKEIKEGDPWYNNPYDYGYMVLYGNPNPELGSANQDTSDLASVTNATHGTDYAAITLRSAPMSNFDNYTTIWFTIEPADLATDVTMGGTFHDTVAWDGTMAPQNDVVFTYNGMTLVQGQDYLIQYTKGAGNTMTATFQGIGNYTGTVSKTYTVTGTQATFSDTPADAWFVQDGSLEFVATNGIMGVADGKTGFKPYDSVSRAMVATVLYRIATAQTEGTTNNAVAAPFPDVPTNQWYTAAVAWAQQKGIVTGYTDTGLFKPNNPVTRQELGLMIARFAKYFYVDTTIVDPSAVWSKELTNYNLISDWALDGMAWCVSKGIFNNYGNLNPLGNAQRCEMAKILRVTCTEVVFVTPDGQMLTLMDVIGMARDGEDLSFLIDEPDDENVLDEEVASDDTAADGPAGASAETPLEDEEGASVVEADDAEAQAALEAGIALL